MSVRTDVYAHSLPGWQKQAAKAFARAMELNTRAIRRRLEREGWYLARQGKHEIYKHADSTETIRLPRHRTVSIGVARQIAAQAGWE